MRMMLTKANEVYMGPNAVTATSAMLARGVKTYQQAQTMSMPSRSSAQASPSVSLGMRPPMRQILKNSEQQSHASATTSAVVVSGPAKMQTRVTMA